ncbi:MAG: LON peptidase substrate-binding domain-containing protein [Candidatus Eremiobacteraeota bacterium]|nr:LON peptidase substrate-binding domain-containing protein [Candidatus Eremiobacteraeota bacterium]
MSRRLRLFPLNAVLFPGTVLNLHVFEPRYKQLIDECVRNGEDFGVVLIHEGREAGDPAVEPRSVGSVAQITEVTQLPFGRFFVSTIGGRRFRIVKILSREPFLTVEAEMLADVLEERGTALELCERVRSAFIEYLKLTLPFSGEEKDVDLPEDPLRVSYVVGDALHVADGLKQRLLEIDSADVRLKVELGFLERLLPQLQKLLERRQARDPKHSTERTKQEKYFGKYFSLN